jgi:branched-chain amino acid aminotransferase
VLPVYPSPADVPYVFLSLFLQLLEAFGAGTAAVVSPVRAIVYKEQTIEVPTGEQAGPVAEHLWNTLRDIQYGTMSHPWSVVL